MLDPATFYLTSGMRSRVEWPGPLHFDRHVGQICELCQPLPVMGRFARGGRCHRHDGTKVSRSQPPEVQVGDLSSLLLSKARRLNSPLKQCTQCVRNSLRGTDFEVKAGRCAALHILCDLTIWRRAEWTCIKRSNCIVVPTVCCERQVGRIEHCDFYPSIFYRGAKRYRDRLLTTSIAVQRWLCAPPGIKLISNAIGYEKQYFLGLRGGAAVAR